MSRSHTARGRGRTEVVIYGRHAVLEALRAPLCEVRELRMARDLPGALRSEVAAACRDAQTEFTLHSKNAVAELSRDARNDQGIAARVWLGGVCDLDAFLAERAGAAARHPTRLIALDGLTNSQNVGMIVRSAVAAGIDGIVWPTAGTPWINGLAIKASSGAVFRARILRCETPVLGLSELRAAGYHCVGLSAEGDSDLFALTAPHRCVVVVGNESQGLADETRALLDASARIPVSSDVESLNAAVAASLGAYWLSGKVFAKAQD